MNNTLHLEYTTKYGGHGIMDINISEFFPCTAAQFKIVLDTMAMCDNSGDLANQLYETFKYHFDNLIEDRDREDADSAVGKSRISKYNTEIKKWAGLSAKLAKAFGTPELKDSDSSIKTKAATVYAMKMDRVTKQRRIEVHTGRTFEKFGYTFEIYNENVTKKPGQNRYTVLLAGTGTAVTTGNKSIKSAIMSISPRTIELLKNAAENIATAKRDYIETMIAAGYMTAEETAEETKEETKEETAEETTEETAEETAEEKTEDHTKEEVTTMTKDYFEGVNTLEGLRAAYKDLLKKNHPDNGGDVAAMQEINAQYDKKRADLKNAAPAADIKTAKWSDIEDEKIREALAKIITLEGINIEIVGSWIWVDGATFPHKEELKAAGFTWSRARKKWHFAPYDRTRFYKGKKKDFDTIRRTYGSEKVDTEPTKKIA